MKVYIFGAHSRANTTAKYIKTIFPGSDIVAYLYDNDEVNDCSIDNAPVLDIRRKPTLDTSLPVYIATKGVYHEPIIKRLKSAGFSDIRPVTVAVDMQLRREYIRKTFANRGWDFRMIDSINPLSKDETTTACIYEVRSVYDKPLTKENYEKQKFERSIQVGAQMTNVRLDECCFYDNSGENISSMNRQMCETTAIFWIWKNALEDYQGLVHYRRHFLLPEDWLNRIVTSSIDVLLPVPMYLGPSIADNYRFRHVSEDWDTLMQVFKEKSDADYTNAMKCFRDNVFFPCNMFIMKRELFCEYAEWLFGYLFEVVKRVGKHEDTYQNRYPAFMAERLLTLFCLSRIDKLNIVYADKNFLT